MNPSNSNHYLQNFNTAYLRLNTAQKEAVDAIDGPVAVIAGPGTGKTQILAVRIGKILLETDTNPHNILCLTYTDSATISMRKRLVEIIGPEAHKIHIYTFHAFSNQVIQENLDIFGNYRQLDPISDLEKVDVFDELLNQLPNDHILKRLKGDPRYEARRMRSLFEMMKKENLSSEQLTKEIETTVEALRVSDQFIAKRKTTTKSKTYLKGDFRDDKFEVEKRKFDETCAAADQLKTYNDIMAKKDRYDFYDMILWVVNAFSTNQDLLLKYQERYHYFLVDEFQDTNGAQNSLLELLIAYWEDSPNVFVVGDPDQAIYKFQGASSENLDKFRNKYNAQLIVLQNNYRSNQQILDASCALINYPLKKSETSIEEVRNLISSADTKKADPTKPIIRAYENISHELASLATEIEHQYKNKVDLSKVAVLYRSHKQVGPLSRVLDKKGIPYNIKKKIDILKDPIIDNILNILYYIQSEYDKPSSEEFRLFELMHYNFFGIAGRETARLALAYKKEEDRNVSFRDIISSSNLLDEYAPKSKAEIVELNHLLEKWTSDIASTTLQVLFENIINEGHILSSILQHPDKVWLLQIVNTLFDFIKQETTRNPDLKLLEFLETIGKMKDTGIALEINKVISASNGINFITAHSSKGMEFETVYLIGCTKDEWENKRGGRNQYKLPEQVNSNSHQTVDDDRKLFYVAMTRAEKNLIISYANNKDEGKQLDKCQFIDEILSDYVLETTSPEIDENIMSQFIGYTLLKVQKEAQLIDYDLIEKELSKYQLSVTGLNKYLKCKIRFYFEDILRVPSARTAYTGFGKSVHLALQRYFKNIKQKETASKSILTRYFVEAMDRYKSHFTLSEFENLKTHGQNILSQYYEQYLENLVPALNYELEYPIRNAEYMGIPIKGILDKVAVHSDHIEVVDYKTGNYDRAKPNLKGPTDRKPEGGDYWRQIVFYKLLILSDRTNNWNMTHGYMDFVEPNKKTEVFSKEKIVVQPEDIELVGSQIQSVWKDLNDHKFNALCDDDSCYWCNFVRNDYVFNTDLKDEMEMEVEGFE